MPDVTPCLHRAKCAGRSRLISTSARLRRVLEREEPPSLARSEGPSGQVPVLIVAVPRRWWVRCCGPGSARRWLPGCAVRAALGRLARGAGIGGGCGSAAPSSGCWSVGRASARTRCCRGFCWVDGGMWSTRSGARWGWRPTAAGIARSRPRWGCRARRCAHGCGGCAGGRMRCGAGSSGWRSSCPSRRLGRRLNARGWRCWCGRSPARSWRLGCGSAGVRLRAACGRSARRRRPVGCWPTGAGCGVSELVIERPTFSTTR